MKYWLILYSLLICFSTFSQSTDKKVSNFLKDNKISKAQKRLNRIKSKGTDTLDYMYLQAKIYRISGEYNKALELLDSVLVLDSLNANAIDEKAIVYAITGKPYETCLYYFNKALKIKEGDPVILGHRGALHYSYDQYRQAIKDYKVSLENDPKNDAMLYNLGLCYYSVDEDLVALLYFNKALKYNPRDPKAHFDRGMTYYYLDEYKKAKSDFKKALRYKQTENQYELLDDNEIKKYIADCERLLAMERQQRKQMR